MFAKQFCSLLVTRVPSPGLRGHRGLAAKWCVPFPLEASECTELLPKWSRETAKQREDLRFRRVPFGNDILREVKRAVRRRSWTVTCLRDGHLAATPIGGQSVVWGFRPPPVLSAWFSLGDVNMQDWPLASNMPRAPGAVVLVLLSADRAALGLVDPTTSELQEHKVIKTYAVRGNDKSTGRSQLFESTRGGKSEGSKLRRQCALRMFEKINSKLVEWCQRGTRVMGDLRRPTVVFYTGDLRLRRMLLDCKKPSCPLPDGKERWFSLPGPHAGSAPSFDTLQRAARFVCRGEVAELVSEVPDMKEQVLVAHKHTTKCRDRKSVV